MTNITRRFLQVRQNCRAFLFATAALTAAASAVAGPLATTPLAYNDGNGPDGGIWRGSVTINASSGMIPSNQVSAVVDYAVFPPGSRFADFLTANGYTGADPSMFGEAVYAYQISSVTSANPGISAFSVGFDETDLVSLVTNVATGLGGELTPTAANQDGTSGRWTFNPAAGAGDFSTLMVITSPSEPQLDSMQISSGIAAGLGQAPSPTDTLGEFREIPEPAAAILALTGLAGVIAARRRRG